jgi:hypothetical protein
VAIQEFGRDGGCGGSRTIRVCPVYYVATLRLYARADFSFPSTWRTTDNDVNFLYLYLCHRTDAFRND